MPLAQCKGSGLRTKRDIHDGSPLGFSHVFLFEMSGTDGPSAFCCGVPGLHFAWASSPKTAAAEGLLCEGAGEISRLNYRGCSVASLRISSGMFHAKPSLDRWPAASVWGSVAKRMDRAGVGMGGNSSGCSTRG